METLNILMVIMNVVQLALNPLHIDCISRLLFNLNAYINKNQQMFLSFDVGLLAAMLVYCLEAIKQIYEEMITKVRQSNLSTSDTLVNFCVMSFPALIIFVGFRASNISLGSLLRSPHRVVMASIITGVVAVVMFFCDRRENAKKHMTRKDALIVGFSQLLSLIPGVYRLDISFIAMRYLGFSRIDSFRNFILLSIPLQIYWCIEHAIVVWNNVFYAEKIEIFWPAVSCVVTFIPSLGICHICTSDN